MFGDITPESIAYQWRSSLAVARPSCRSCWPRPKHLDPDFNLLASPPHDRHGLRGPFACTAPSPASSASRRHELPGPRQPRQCQHRPGTAAQHPQRGRRAIRLSATWRTHGPARQVHAVLRRAQLTGPSPPSPRRRGLGADASAYHGGWEFPARRKCCRRRRGCTPEAILSPIGRRCGRPSSCRAMSPRTNAASRSFCCAGDGAEDRASRRLGIAPGAALPVRRGPRRGRAPDAIHAIVTRRRGLQDELPADLGRRLADV